MSQGFQELIDRVRAGDAAAAVELVRGFERELRIVARVRLNDPRLRRLVDTMDVCQSVVGNFFVRISAGQFEIKSPEELLALLGKMVGNKVTDLARKHQAARRDHRRLDHRPVEELLIHDNQDTPSQIASAKELATAVRQRLSPVERELVDARMQGQDWHELARQRGRSAEALRKEFSHAIDRAASQLGLLGIEHV